MPRPKSDKIKAMIYVSPHILAQLDRLAELGGHVGEQGQPSRSAAIQAIVSQAAQAAGIKIPQNPS